MPHWRRWFEDLRESKRPTARASVEEAEIASSAATPEVVVPEAAGHAATTRAGEPNKMGSAWNFILLVAAGALPTLISWWIDLRGLTQTDPALSWVVGGAIVSISLLVICGTDWLRHRVKRAPFIASLLIALPSLIGAGVWMLYPSIPERITLSANTRRQNDDGTVDIYVRNDSDSPSAIQQVVACDDPEWALIRPDGTMLGRPSTAEDTIAFLQAVRSSVDPFGLLCFNESFKALEIVDGKQAIPPHDIADLRVGPYPNRWKFAEAEPGLIHQIKEFCPIEVKTDTGYFTIVNRCEIKPVMPPDPPCVTDSWL